MSRVGEAEVLEGGAVGRVCEVVSRPIEYECEGKPYHDRSGAGAKNIKLKAAEASKVRPCGYLVNRPARLPPGLMLTETGTQPP